MKPRRHRRRFKQPRRAPPKVLRHCRVGSCIPKFFSVTGFIGCLACFLVLFLLLLTFLMQPCINDGHCATENPCSIDFCHNNFCKHEYKDDCCYRDKDCNDISCHTVYCNKVTNKCSASQQQNGTACDDHSRCTVNDRCVSGKCMGNTVLCNGNPCMNGKCYKDKGCVYTKKEDKTPCTDSDPCTLNDQCFAGQCTAGLMKSCSSLDDACNTGICDSTNGECIAMPKPEGSVCDQSTGICDEPNARCSNGECVARRKTCYDANPCTVEACVEPFGCMIQYNFTNGVCLPGCQEHSDCPNDFLCIDGTCIDIEPDAGINVRFIDYELENKTEGHRLLLSFIMDAEIDRIGNDVFYRIVKEAGDISTSTAQPLGFVDEVININSIVLPSGSRTAFTLATAYQDINQINCNTMFADRTYKFDLKISHCKNILTQPDQCIDPNLHVQTSVTVSVSDCAQFSVSDTLHTYSEGVLWFNNVKFTGLNSANQIILNATSGKRTYAGIETNVYNNDDMVANIYSMRICIPDYEHHMASCVDGTSPNYCPLKGCYGWSPMDNPMYLSYDIMQRGYITAVAKSDVFKAYGCYVDEVYRSDTAKCDLHQKCPTAGWPYVMDDGISFLFTFLDNHPELQTVGYTLVFDIVYRITGCHNLRSSAEEKHKLTKIKIVL